MVQKGAAFFVPRPFVYKKGGDAKRRFMFLIVNRRLSGSFSGRLIFPVLARLFPVVYRSEGIALFPQAVDDLRQGVDSGVLGGRVVH